MPGNFSLQMLAKCLTVLCRNAALVLACKLIHKRFNAVLDGLGVAGHRNVQMQVAVTQVTIGDHLGIGYALQPLSRFQDKLIHHLQWEAEVVLVDWPCM